MATYAPGVPRARAGRRSFRITASCGVASGRSTKPVPLVSEHSQPGSFGSTGTDMSLPLKELIDFYDVDKRDSAVLACSGGTEEGGQRGPGAGAATPASRSCFRPTPLLSPWVRRLN